jgi:hypothetical protein
LYAIIAHGEVVFENHFISQTNPERYPDVVKSAKRDEVVATVQRIFRGQKPYAVTTAEGISGEVTFSLGPDANVWQESDWPERGMKVVLGDLRKKREWRAFKARFLRPEDEELK